MGETLQAETPTTHATMDTDVRTHNTRPQTHIRSAHVQLCTQTRVQGRAHVKEQGVGGRITCVLVGLILLQVSLLL